MSAVDMAKQVADQAVPTADRINQKIEKQAHELTANAEFHAKDVASEYQKGAKVRSPSASLFKSKTGLHCMALSGMFKQKGEDPGNMNQRCRELLITALLRQGCYQESALLLTTLAHMC